MGNDWENWSSQPDESSHDDGQHRIDPVPRRTAWRRKRREDAEMSAEAGTFPTNTGYVPSVKRHESYQYRDSDRNSLSFSSTVGWIGLVFAIASWFLWPVFLGPTAAALGVYAYYSGSRALGAWAMALGLIAAAAYLVLIPLYYAVR
ncbi:hypothetical protein [Paenibacillus sp. MMS18-CY102]|uniref:hypothetical protein n=1 Tax=Paenibacillus sp. MMS18-CY102 TaxID=2682849 RepID=UPI0013657332|nr:hypothetical protein [Paenibacillus sp. MMS18-CY102]MWC27474.1 hypothetical protein [Paenibacillus sp. MMS18-CY102]